jgi:predicted component of type VI protein secretion system
MSNLEQSDNFAAVRRLSEEIAELHRLQAAAQNTAAINGMTADESTQYKERHRRLKELLTELATLDRRHKACTRLE